MAHRFEYFSGPATDEQIARVAPSVFTTVPHASRSERYSQITTADVLDGLRGEGWHVFGAGQTLARTGDRRDYTKHMLRLRHSGAAARSLTDNESAAELLLLNAHDGTSQYQMYGGAVRFACLNGIIAVGAGCLDFCVRHTGDATRKVIEGSFIILDGLTRVVEDRDTMRGIALAPLEQIAFASSALQLQYGDGPAPIRASQLLEARRYEDRGHDLWTTFNVVQENLVKGGVRGVNAAGRRSTTRGVVALGKDVKLNRALWTLADTMKRLKLGEAVSAGEQRELIAA